MRCCDPSPDATPCQATTATDIQTYRHIGMECSHKDNFREAQTHFRKALSHHFTPRSLSHVIESFLRARLQQS